MKNRIDQVWQQKDETKRVKSEAYLRATMNSPWAPKTASFSGFLTLYVLLMTAARPAERRTEVVAIRVDPIMVFRRVWTAKMLFLSMS